MVDDFAISNAQRQDLTWKLEIWRNFLKQQYDCRATTDDDGSDTHDVELSLKNLRN